MDKEMTNQNETNEMEKMQELAYEHLAIRRTVNSMFIEAFSNVIKGHKAQIVTQVLNFLPEEKRERASADLSDINVSIFTYENIAMLSSDNSPIFDSNKQLFYLTREIFKVAKGFEDKSIPVEIVNVPGYPNNRYIVFREGAYVFGIDAGYDDIKEMDPSVISIIYVNPNHFSNVYISLMLNHIQAWMPSIFENDYMTEEVVQELLTHIGSGLLFCARAALNNVHAALTTDYENPMNHILRSYEHYNYRLEFETLLSNDTMSLTVYDESMVSSLAEDLAEDLEAAEDGDETLMDVIDREEIETDVNTNIMPEPEFADNVDECSPEPDDACTTDPEMINPKPDMV